MLLGKCTRERLQQNPYGEWFNKNYQDYQVDTFTAKKLKEKLSGEKFIIFMGTWCGDSKREVPRMFKLLDYCGVKADQIQLIMVDSRDSVYKQSPTHEERGLHIHRVPDLLLFEKNNELGRIVESPVVSIEKDLLAIANGEKYTPNYQIVPLLFNLFKQKNIAAIQNDLPAIALQAKPLMKHPAELNSFGHVLIAAGEMDKAFVALKLNLLLYPDNPTILNNLGEYYYKSGNKKLSIESYQKTLQVEPGNEQAKKMLGELGIN